MLFSCIRHAVLVAAACLAAATDRAHAFTAAEDGFSIDFPGTPDVREQPPDASGVKIRMYLLAQEPMRWAVFVATLPEGAALADQAVFDLLTPKYPAECFRDERRGTFGGGVSRDFAVVCEAAGGKSVQVRQAKIGNRLYMAMGSGPPGFETGSDAQKFIDSFQVTPAR